MTTYFKRGKKKIDIDSCPMWYLKYLLTLMYLSDREFDRLLEKYVFRLIFEKNRR